MEDKYAIQSVNCCFHCGQPIDDNIDITVNIGNTSKNVCCFGCKAVCELIIVGGLENYYKYRTAYAEKKNESADIYSEYDHPNFQNIFCSTLENADKLVRARLLIDNIHCAACVWLLENSCNNMPGVEQIKINLVDGAATLDWDKNLTNLSAVINRISDLGYKVAPWSQSSKQASLEEQKKYLIRRVGLAGIVMMQVGMFSVGLYAGEFQGIEKEYQNLLYWFAALLTTPVLLYSAQPFFIGAWRSLKNRSINMDVPVATALSVAYIASMYAIVTDNGNIYFDSICMFVFLLLGVRFLDLQARSRIKRVLTSGNISPVCRLISDKTSSVFETVPIHAVEPGKIIMVRSGEAIPVDGKLLSETATLNEANINGEFLPVTKTAGSLLLSGAINTSNTLTMIATKRAADSWLQSVEALAFDAQQARPAFLQISDKVARYFSFTVLLASCIAALVWFYLDASRVVEVCIAMLVISCPCALSLAAPSALTVASNFLREQGALICDANILEKLNRVSRICFDKTGTLTKGEFTLVKTHLFSDGQVTDHTEHREPVYSIATALEAWSEHPIASAFNSSPGEIKQIYDVKNIPNAGVSGFIDGVEYRIGSIAFCRELCQVTVPGLNTLSAGQLVWLATQAQWLACFELNDTPRSEVAKAVQALKRFKPVLLTGDNSLAAQHIATQLGIDEYKSACTPQDKQNYIAQLQSQNEVVMMVGDGINDMPVLAQADVSIAINSANDLTKNQADCILLNNNPGCLPLLFAHANSCYKIIRQNIAWALSYNFMALPLAAAGLVPPWLAAIGMSASSLVVILNAARLRRPL